ncbi:uncharacterized protein LOC114250612 [Bombyx mandarina]|uniref:Uncharacterized protein LOC114250612 n=1 Tax=Bombyx mandarina TaxID=7092 RepID=A0A6J2KHF1_BOMMA|nr:uncharacterized protein LOC114250612 [Bombyx mandarina]
MTAEDTSVLLNIGEMIDLAIGTPEVGVVDFNMLQTVLHCLAQQLRVLGKNVELKGSITLPIGRDNTQTIAISEYVVDTEDKDKTAPLKPEIEVSPVTSEPDTILVVERIKKSLSPLRSPTREHSPVPIQTRGAASPTPQEKLSLVTLSKFNTLESTVEDLKNRVYGSMPKNEAILEEVRSQTNLKAITDMWTSLNVSSRLEAAEAGISKLSSLVQDVISETTTLQDALKGSDLQALDSVTPGAALTDLATIPTKDEFSAVQTQLHNLQANVDQLTNSFNGAMSELLPGFASSLPGQLASEQTQDSSSTPGADHRHSTTSRSLPTADKLTDILTKRINELEKKLKECCDIANKNDDLMQNQINYMQDQLEYINKEIVNMTTDPTGGKLSPDLVKDLQGLMQLFQTVQDMQEQLKQVHETALLLASEKEDKQLHTNALLEQIELLKTVKLDREDMMEAMAEKADLQMLARKVSHNQFELACDDLSRGLEHALGKLNLQEALWQQALDDIQREIETKLDKMELSPVKDFFNNKLKQLQENLKQMASLRREAEAAGTKQKLLRDVNCISCDANAVMKMEAPSTVPVSKPLPANLSMKPYLSYELDAIRKSQASNLPQRNLHDWENIDKHVTKQPPRPKSESDKHLCNRYCGGSHTVTTPAQRVARLGHFIKQWGPDVLPLSSGLATGDDGKMYRVTEVESANVGPGGAVDQTCTPKSPQKKSDTNKTQHKSAAITPECRCLEGNRFGK